MIETSYWTASKRPYMLSTVEPGGTRPAGVICDRVDVLVGGHRQKEVHHVGRETGTDGRAGFSSGWYRSGSRRRRGGRRSAGAALGGPVGAAVGAAVGGVAGAAAGHKVAETVDPTGSRVLSRLRPEWELLAARRPARLLEQPWVVPSARSREPPLEAWPELRPDTRPVKSSIRRRKRSEAIGTE